MNRPHVALFRLAAAGLLLTACQAATVSPTAQLVASATPPAASPVATASPAPVSSPTAVASPDAPATDAAQPTLIPVTPTSLVETTLPPTLPTATTQPVATRTATPTVDAACAPPAVFDPVLNRCRLPDPPTNTPQTPAANATPTVAPTATPSSTPSAPVRAPGTAAPDLVVNSLGDEPDAAPDGICETAPGSGACTLRAALQEANASDDISTIGFAPELMGTIALGGSLPAVTRGVSLYGPGPDILAIDAGQAGFRVLTFDSPPGPAASEVRGLTLTGGQSDLGGGLFVGAGHSLTLADSQVHANQAMAGGGAYVSGGSLTLLNTTVSDNSAGQNGGGIYSFDSSLALWGARITGNQAESGRGAGIYHDGTGMLSASGGLLGGNGPAQQGGGLWVNGTALLSALTLADNRAGDGGGIFVQGGNVSLVAGTASANRAANGAGIYNHGGILHITNATLSGNQAEQFGGGLYNAATAALNNATVAHNEAGIGGGLHTAAGSLALRNSLIANQVAGSDCSGPLASLGHNLDSDGSCALAASGDIAAANPLIDALGSYGGPTATHRLQPGSLAIDAANVSGCPTTDQRGHSRPQIGSAAAAASSDNTLTCDIGAVEYSPGIDP
jgi:CSLREA domain-containing protein